MANTPEKQRGDEEEVYIVETTPPARNLPPNSDTKEGSNHHSSLYQLSEGIFERRFRKEIIRALKKSVASFSRSLDDESTACEEAKLVEIQFKMFELYLATYNHAVNGVKRILLSTTTDETFSIDRIHMLNPLVWPEELNSHMKEDPVHIPFFESYEFADENILHTFKTELLPDFIETLLQLDIRENLSALAQYSLGCIVLHFVQFMVAMLKLNEHKYDNQDGISVTADITAANGIDSNNVISQQSQLGKKRRRSLCWDKEDKVNYSVYKYILHSIGFDLLECLADILGADAFINVFKLYARSLIHGPNGDSDHWFLKYLPSFYQSHSITSADDPDPFSFSRSSGNGKYKELYCMPQIETLSIEKIELNHFSLHLLAASRLLIKSNALKSMNDLLETILEGQNNDDGSEPISIMYFKQMLRIYLSILIMAPCIPSKIEDSSQMYHQKQSILDTVSTFRESLITLLDSVNIEKSLPEAKILMDVLDISEYVCIYEESVDQQVNQYPLQSGFFTIKELYATKISILWKILSGMKAGRLVKKATCSPSLQLQVFSLKTLMTWIQKIEEDIFNLEKRLHAIFSDESYLNSVNHHNPELKNGNSSESDERNIAQVSTIETNGLKTLSNSPEKIERRSNEAMQVEITLNQLNLRQLLVLNHLKSEDHNFLRYILASCAHSELLRGIQDLPLILLRSNLLEISDLLSVWTAAGMNEDHGEQKHESITTAVHNMLLIMLKSDNCWNTRNNRFLFHYIESLFEELDVDTTWSVSKLSLLESTILRSIEVQKDTSTVPNTFHLALKLASKAGVKMNEAVISGAFDCLKEVLKTLLMKACTCSGHQNCISTAKFLCSVFEWIVLNFSEASVSERTTCSRLLCELFSTIPLMSKESMRPDLDFPNLVCFGNFLKYFPFIIDSFIQETLQFTDDLKQCGRDRNVYSENDCVKFRRLLLQSYVKKCEDYAKAINVPISSILRLNDHPQLDRLWILLFEDTSEEVGNLVIDYLATLYNLLELPNNTMKSAIQGCISEFGINDKSSKKTKRILSFLLQLTRPYSEAFREASIQMHDYLNDNIFRTNVSSVLQEPTPFIISVVEIANEVNRYSIKCQNGSETLLRSLQCFIDTYRQTNKSSPNPWLYRIIYRRRELKDTPTAFKSVGIKNGGTIFLITSVETGNELSSEESQVAESFKREMMTRVHRHQFNVKCLDREENRSTLFSLLTFDDTSETCWKQEEINELGWELLQRLPTEKDLELKIKQILTVHEINEGCLQQSFPPHIFRLCYSLEILERLIIETNYFGPISVDVSPDERNEVFNMYCSTEERIKPPTATALIDHFLQLIDHMCLNTPTTIEQYTFSGEIPFTIITYSKIVHFLLAALQSGRCCVSKFQTIKFVTLVLKMVEYCSNFSRVVEDPSIEFKRYIWPKDELSAICAVFTLECLNILMVILTSDTVFHSEVLTYFCQNSDLNRASILLQKAMVSSIVRSKIDAVSSHAKSVFSYLFCSDDLTVSSSQQQIDIASFFLSVFKLINSKSLFNVQNLDCLKDLYSLAFEIMSNIYTQCSKDQRNRILTNLIQRCFYGDVLSNRPHHDFYKIRSIEEIGDLFVYSFVELLEVLESEHVSTDSIGFAFDGIVDFTCNCIELFDCDVLKELVSKTELHGDEFLWVLTEMCFEQRMFSERRSIILSLVSRLCLGIDSNMMYLLTKLEVYINTGSPRHSLLTKWHSHDSKDEVDFVGLKNQGATCYLNSLLQQLFYLDDFRDRVLSLDVMESDNPEYKLLHCLKDMFRTMLISRCQKYDTMELIRVLPKNGESICVDEQQDVEEFLNMFTDRMESTLSSTADPNLMSDIFGGTLSHLITCKRCGFTSERIEDSRSISLDILGQKSLESSLSGFIQEEFLNGDNQYFCNKCNERQDSIKRCCFNEPPQILVCHLKRFTFNLETLRKMKRNDRFEFPIESLDLTQYTKNAIYENENLKSDLLYTLQGVIIHRGSADSGHYYSLAKVKPSGIEQYGMSTNLYNVKKEEWFNFNDTITKPFDMDSLEYEAFGGPNTNHNAYILIYTKKEGDNRRQLKLHSHDKELAAILEENKLLVQCKILLSGQCEPFIKRVCTSEALTQEMMNRAIWILTIFVFEFHVHSFAKDEKEVLKTFSTLRDLYTCNSNEKTSLDFFKIVSSTHRLYLEKMLLHCEHKDLRIAFSYFICFLYDRCEKNFNTVGLIEDNEDDIDLCEFDYDDDIQVMYMNVTNRKRLGRVQYWKSNSILERFKGCIFDLIDICGPQWRNCDTLFELLDHLARKSHEESIWMIRSGIILRLLDIYLRDTPVRIPQTSIPRQKNISPRNFNHPSIGNRRKKSNMKELLSLLRTLVCSAQKPDTNEVHEVSDSSESEAESESFTQESTPIARSPYLTENAKKVCDEVIYFLPVRDARILTTKDFMKKLESEREDANNSNSNQVSEIVDQIINHLTF